MQTTHSQYTLPESGKKLASKATRDGVAARFADAAVPKTIALDLSLSTSYAELRKALALSSLQTARPHDATTLYLRHTVPGIGKIISLVLLYERHQSERFPPGPACAAYCRRGQGSKDSGGKRLGPAGKNIGHAHRTWAFAEAAPLGLRKNPQAHKLLARLEKQHDTGTARRIRAHTRGRAVSWMLKRKVAVEMTLFLPPSGSRAAEPGASRDS